jgi:hypothetical protein
VIVFAAITALWYIPTAAMSGWNSPLHQTLVMQRQFTSGYSVVCGGSFFENVRSAVRFLLYFPGVFGLGGCIVFAAMFRGKSPRFTALALAATVPFFLIGIILYMPLPQYYAPITGFCITFVLLTGRMPASRRIVAVCIIVNLLFFWLIPRPIEVAGRFHSRSIAATVKKQASLVGANGAKVLLYNNELMRTAEAVFAQCDRFYTPLLWDRIWIYLAQRRWHNRFTASPDSADCIILPVPEENNPGRGFHPDVRIKRAKSRDSR